MSILKDQSFAFMKLGLFIALISLQFIGSSQSQVKYKLDNSDGYFYAYATPAVAKGMLILIPDFNQTEEDLLARTELPSLAYHHGIVTIIIPCGKKLFADREVNRRLTEAIRKSLTAYELASNKVILGGFGSGGTIAIKYGEYCTKFERDYPINPAALFAIESHVDLIEAYRSIERRIANSVDQRVVLEGKISKNLFEKDLDGTPDSDGNLFANLTPFNRLDSQNENIKSLINTPIRLYNDTDITWNLKNKQISGYDLPGIAASEMVVQLNALGNKNAEFVKTNLDSRVIGEKANTKRTEVNENDLMLWILKYLKIN